MQRCDVRTCNRIGFIEVRLGMPGKEVTVRICGRCAASMEGDKEPTTGTREHAAWAARAVAREVQSGAPF